MAFLLCFPTSPPPLFYKRTCHPDPHKMLILRHYSAIFSVSQYSLPQHLISPGFICLSCGKQRELGLDNTLNNKLKMAGRTGRETSIATERCTRGSWLSRAEEAESRPPWGDWDPVYYITESSVSSKTGFPRYLCKWGMEKLCFGED